MMLFSYINNHNRVCVCVCIRECAITPVICVLRVRTVKKCRKKTKNCKQFSGIDGSRESSLKMLLNTVRHVFTI